MKKLFKIAGIALLSLIGLLLAIFLLARFVFREQAIDYLTGLEKQQRVELLRAAGPYAADTVQYRFTYKQDTVRAREIREYFRLDTIVNPAGDDLGQRPRAGAVRRPEHSPRQSESPARNAQRNRTVGVYPYRRTGFQLPPHSILLHELRSRKGSSTAS